MIQRQVRFKVPVGGLSISARGRRYVNQALKNNRLSYGPFLRRFEETFARAHDSRWSISCNSGTSALHVAIAALQMKGRWRPGDEVLVPAVTFVATSNMAILQGLKPVFVDVDPRTYNIDPAQIERHVTKRTRLIEADMPRAGLEKHETDHVGTGIEGGTQAGGAGKAADFDGDHANLQTICGPTARRR